MPPNCSKNAILSGIADYYCLVCENYLGCEDDINNHIVKSTHKKNLEKTSFEIEDECIRKIKLWYFCEFCNYLIKTRAKIRLHIAEQKHIDNKIRQCLLRDDNTIVAFGEISINNRAWNGLSDGTCLICACEYLDEQDHLNYPIHNINLIQHNIQIDGQKNIYRLIDETSFQCLTCNSLESITSIYTHFIDADHKKLFEKCRKSATEPLTNKAVTKISQANNDSSQTETIKNIASPENENNTSTQSDIKNYNIEENEKLICKVFKTDNYTTRNVEGQMWCILCDWTMDAFETGSHVNGVHHRNILKLHNARFDKLKQTAVTSANKHDKMNDEKPNAECKLANKSNENKHSNLKDDLDNCTTILESLEYFQKYEVNVNFVTKSAICKKCSNSIEFNFEAIKKHIDEHETDNMLRLSESLAKRETNAKKFPLLRKPVENTKLFSSPVSLTHNKTGNASRQDDRDDRKENFAKANKLMYKPGEKIVYCGQCRTNLPFSLKNMEEHINGIAHKTRANAVEKVNRAKTVETIPVDRFIHSTGLVQHNLGLDIVINEEFCITYFSMILFTKCEFPNRFQCFVCMEYTINFSEHSLKHANVDVSVVTSVPSEFIRVIRSNCYHCGFCNKIFNSWEVVENHLQSTSHKDNKMCAKWRLDQHLPKITDDQCRPDLRERFMISTLLREMLNRNSDTDSD